MKKIKNSVKKFFQEESAQGLTEYVLLAVVVIGLVVMFREPVTQAVRGQIDKLSGQISSFGN